MKNQHTTGWEKPSSAQMKDFWSQVDAGRINKRNFQTFLRHGVKNSNQDLARDILGKDFISPDEVLEVRGLTYTEEQLQILEQTVPDKETLKQFRDNNMALMPAPPEALNLLQIRELKSNLFHSKEEGWYSKKEERKAFSETDKTTFGWIAIRRDELPNSPNKDWEEQNIIVPKTMRVPNAAELAWFITTYELIRKEKLFTHIWVRTSTTASNGRPVLLPSGSDGLVVDGDWDGVRYSLIAISVAWKF